MQNRYIFIGSSTGGPGHIQKILSALPKDFRACIFSAQHIDKIFINHLADSFKSSCKLNIEVAEHKKQLLPSQVLLAKGGFANKIESYDKGYQVALSEDAGTFSPCIDTLFYSLSRCVTRPKDILAIILTGIGSDGANGLLALKNAGVSTVAESEKTAIVYGMPKVAKEIGAAEEILDLPLIIEKIISFGS